MDGREAGATGRYGAEEAFQLAEVEGDGRCLVPGVAAPGRTPVGVSRGAGGGGIPQGRSRDPRGGPRHTSPGPLDGGRPPPPRGLEGVDLVQRSARFERHSKNPHIFALRRHPHTRYPKTPFLVHGVQRYGCLGRHPRTQSMIFGTVQFKHHHPRYPKTPLLVYDVQGCVRSGCHPRTQTIVFGIVHCKHLHPRYSKTPFLAHGVQRYRCLGRHPKTQTIFFGGHCGSFGPRPPSMAGQGQKTTPEHTPAVWSTPTTLWSTPTTLEDGGGVWKWRGSSTG